MRFGKLRGVARGARRLKSRLGGMIEPFTLCQLDLFEKPGDSLYRISQVTIDEPFSKFRDDLTLMTAAGRMVNLVNAVMAEGDAEPRVFDMLESGLRLLLDSRDAAWTTVLFQIRLLGMTGFRPQTEQCATCGQVRQGPLRNSPQWPEGWYVTGVRVASRFGVRSCPAGVSRFFIRRYRFNLHC